MSIFCVEALFCSVLFLMTFFLWQSNFYPHTILRNSIPRSLNISDYECYLDSVTSTRSSTTRTESLKIPTKINKWKKWPYKHVMWKDARKFGLKPVTQSFSFPISQFTSCYCYMPFKKRSWLEITNQCALEFTLFSPIFKRRSIFAMMYSRILHRVNVNDLLDSKEQCFQKLARE